MIGWWFMMICRRAVMSVCHWVTKFWPARRENTALITYEPPSLKFYGTDYIKQYGLVLTSQGPEYLSHAGRRDMPPVGFGFMAAWRNWRKMTKCRKKPD